MSMIDGKLASSRFFLGIDSDGCVFDTMESKHRNAFVPALIQGYELEHIAGLVEEVWCFVNLYSRDRGINRFTGLIKTFEALHRHPVLKRFPGVLSAILPDIRPLKTWAEHAAALSNESIVSEIENLRLAKLNANKQLCHEIDDSTAELKRCLDWSLRVNELAREHVGSAMAFGNSYNFLRMIRPDGAVAYSSDTAGMARETSMIVLSQSPKALLESQWNNAGFARYVDAIHGQEDGNKATLMQEYIQAGFHGNMLMIGDAPGDLEAALSVGAWFFPIIPHHEAESWSRLAYEAWPLFAAGCYNREYQTKLIDEFFSTLPLNAPWEEASVRRVS